MLQVIIILKNDIIAFWKKIPWRVPNQLIRLLVHVIWTRPVSFVIQRTLRRRMKGTRHVNGRHDRLFVTCSEVKKVDIPGVYLPVRSVQPAIYSTIWRFFQLVTTELSVKQKDMPIGLQPATNCTTSILTFAPPTQGKTL